MMNLLKKFAFSFAAICLFTTQATADEKGITISFANSGKSIELLDTELARLPQVAFETTTPWDAVARRFEGPSLKSVLEAVNAEVSNLTLVALNDYKIQIPAEHIKENWPIVARLRDGAAMSVRDKGPYWVLFPFDSDKELQNELYYSFSIWQMAKIIVE